MRSSKPNIGDLVHHCLFLRTEWIALLLRIQYCERDSLEKALVKMVPGTKYEDYFYRTRHSAQSKGWVYSKWLWVYREDNKQ